MDSNLKEQITKLYNKSRELDRLQEEVSKLKKQILPQLKAKGLTKTKFDFEDRSIKFNIRNDTGGITQKGLRAALAEFPEIDADAFMAMVLSQRTRKQTECVDIIKTTPASTAEQ